MHIAVVVFGSFLLYGGRVYAQVRGVPSPPWAFAVDLVVALVPILLVLGDGWVLALARWAWLGVGICTSTVSVWCAHHIGKHPTQSSWWSVLDDGLLDREIAKLKAELREDPFCRELDTDGRLTG